MVPANSVFSTRTAAINVVECAAPNGVVPTPRSCDGNTIQGVTLTPTATVDFSPSHGYTVYSLPNSRSGKGLGSRLR